MSNCIPLAQSWHSLPAWKTAMAARQVKQIWFHSYLVTVRFSLSCTCCNRIRLVPVSLRRNPVPGCAGDGRRMLTDCGWRRGAGPSVYLGAEGMDGQKGGIKEVVKGELKSWSNVDFCFVSRKNKPQKTNYVRAMQVFVWNNAKFPVESCDQHPQTSSFCLLLYTTLENSQQKLF